MERQTRIALRGGLRLFLLFRGLCLRSWNALCGLRVLRRIRLELLRAAVAAKEIAAALIVGEHLVLRRLGDADLDALHRAFDLLVFILSIRPNGGRHTQESDNWQEVFHRNSI